MLLPSLLLMFIACPAQDAPAVPETAPAAAAPAAAPETPTETPQKVREFLVEAQSHLYDPQAAGLKSLAFDVDVDFPGLGPVGAVHVTWAAGQEAQTVFTAAENPGIPAAAAGMLETSAINTAQQLLGSMLNRPLASLLDAGVATMAGVQDSLVAVSHQHPEAAKQGVKSTIYLFDDDSTLQKSLVEAEGQGMSIKMVQTYSWKPAAEGTPLLVADVQSVETSYGPMKQSSKATFSYTQVGAIVLAIRISALNTGQMSGEQVIEAKNLVVNGEAAAVPAALAPAAADPAAERTPSGG